MDGRQIIHAVQVMLFARLFKAGDGRLFEQRVATEKVRETLINCLCV